ncbi:MAG: D-aminoacyl-tRNA deacylase [Lautropia sp.]|nr:D-aminoacyl-tRNA deacylase [Lautropia sp.]
MQILLQRVSQASVSIAGRLQGHIGQGLVVFVCAEPTDTQATVQRAVGKLLGLRIFTDETGRMNHNVQDIHGALLIISQFTLAADTRHGHRPDFSRAAPAAQAEALYDALVAEIRQRHPDTSTGCFGADMQVALVNDGPVTILLHLT